MATPFIGEIKIVGFNFPPRDFAFCNGQLLSKGFILFFLRGLKGGESHFVEVFCGSVQESHSLLEGFGAGESRRFRA